MCRKKTARPSYTQFCIKMSPQHYFPTSVNTRACETYISLLLVAWVWGFQAPTLDCEDRLRALCTLQSKSVPPIVLLRLACASCPTAGATVARRGHRRRRTLGGNRTGMHWLDVEVNSRKTFFLVTLLGPTPTIGSVRVF